MTKKIENESSTTAAIKGGMTPIGYDPEKPEKKQNPKEIDEDEALESLIVRRGFADPPDTMPKEETDEVVRKSGERWVVYDDDEETEQGSYPSRDVAWERQRIYRKRKNYLKKVEREKQGRDIGAKLGLKPSDATVAAKKGGERPIKKLSTRSESLLSSIVGKLLSEGFITRISEEAPGVQEKQSWDDFFNKLSDSVKLSDPKIKPLIEKIEASKGKALKKAVDLAKKTLESTRSFMVSDIRVGKDATTKEWIVDFTITIKRNKKALPMSIKLLNDKPVIFYPNTTKVELNKADQPEYKVLKAELIHIQETKLDNVGDVIYATKKRDDYLNKLSNKVESTLRDMSGVEIAVIKHLAKTKYGSIK